MPIRFLLTLGITLSLVSISSVDSAYGQKRSQTGSRSKTAASPAAKEDKWWAAQRSIETAIQQLEAYLRETPNGNRAASARQELAVLRNLSVSAARPGWVKMGSIGILDIPEWRVASVEVGPDKTKVMLEVRCDRQDGGECRFLPFDRAPLVLVDNSGQYYPMLESAPLPATVKHRSDGQALITSGRILSITVEFAPLATGVVSGQIYYRDDNQAKPAIFSLSTKKGS